MAGQPGLFDLDERYAALSRSGDPLERLGAVVDFEIFRADLDTVLARSDGSKGGRPPMDAVMMFKVLVLQALYGLADEQTEFQIRDRLSFMRFLGLDLHGRVPDDRTIWLFRELLTRAKAIDVLFARFDAHLRDRGYLAMGGQMIDALIIAAPRQRTTDAEKADLKAGRVPEDWAANPAKLRQKKFANGTPMIRETLANDGRWTLKRGRRKRKPDGTLMMEIATPVYGYKSHVGVDRHHRFIRTWSVTDAARYDGRELPGLLDGSNTGSSVWADTRIAPRRASGASPGRGWSRRFTSASRPASRCPSRSSAPTPPARGSGPASSMSSPTRNTAWGCSSAPSASPERGPRSASPTSRATCAASVLGDSNGRASVAQRDPSRALGTPNEIRRETRPFAGRQNPFRRTSNAGR
jgi:IS5 family transposase